MFQRGYKYSFYLFSIVYIRVQCSAPEQHNGGQSELLCPVGIPTEAEADSLLFSFLSGDVAPSPMLHGRRGVRVVEDAFSA